MRNTFLILIRYTILLLIGLSNLYLIYLIFTPITIHFSYFIISLFTSAHLDENVISISTLYIELIPACIAGSAYYLLLILNLSTPMKVKTRVKSILFLLLSFLILNVIRISFLSYLASIGSNYFDTTHAFLWLFGSTILVVLIWFTNIKILKIKAIPLYTDIKYLFKKIN